MSYPQDGTTEYTKGEIEKMYRNGEISKGEKKHLEKINHIDDDDNDD